MQYQADLLFEKVLQYDGPVYFRVARNPTPLVYVEDNAFGVSPMKEFEIGKGYRIKEGKDITLICSGPILIEALKLASLVKESVAVIDMPTIRPVDEGLVEEAARQTGSICTVAKYTTTGVSRGDFCTFTFLKLKYLLIRPSITLQRWKLNDRITTERAHFLLFR